jgi:putative membrane protein
MLIVGGCLLAAAVYARGVRALWRSAGHGRGIKPWQTACFGGGLVALVLTLESPLDALAGALFSAHMVQHLVLLLIAAPLLVLGAPLAPFVWALTPPARRRVGRLRALRAIATMPAALVLHSLAVWAWHLPSLYDAAIECPPMHVLEHVSFLVTAVLFWWALLGSGRVGYGSGVLYVFAIGLQTTLLGALLTFASAPWYTAHLATTAAWGLSPLDDQQVAGLIMWIPGGVVYLLSALALFGAWLKETTSPARTIDPMRRTGHNS